MQSNLFLLKRTEDLGIDFILGELVSQGYVTQEECDYQYEGMHTVRCYNIFKCYSEMLKNGQVVTRVSNITHKLATELKLEYIDATCDLVIFGTGFSPADQIKIYLADLDSCPEDEVRILEI